MHLVHVFDLPDEKSCYGCPMFDYVPCFDEYVCEVDYRMKKTPDRIGRNCPLARLEDVKEYGVETVFWREFEQ